MTDRFINRLRIAVTLMVLGFIYLASDTFVEGALMHRQSGAFVLPAPLMLLLGILIMLRELWRDW